MYYIGSNGTNTVPIFSMKAALWQHGSWISISDSTEWTRKGDESQKAPNTCDKITYVRGKTLFANCKKTISQQCEKQIFRSLSSLPWVELNLHLILNPITPASKSNCKLEQGIVEPEIQIGTWDLSCFSCCFCLGWGGWSFELGGCRSGLGEDCWLLLLCFCANRIGLLCIGSLPAELLISPLYLTQSCGVLCHIPSWLCGGKGTCESEPLIHQLAWYQICETAMEWNIASLHWSVKCLHSWRKEAGRLTE